MQAIKSLNEKEWFHRDISIGNMGFSLRPECGGAVIKLHDFDLSKSHTSNSGTSHWAGTVPFMPIELLEKRNVPHMIGFEVEALTWTLFWIVRVYTNGEDLNPVKDHPLEDWYGNGNNLEQIARTKYRYLANVDGFTNEFYGDLGDEFRQLARLWYNMRLIQEDERFEKRDGKLLLESVYGMTGFNTIETWMEKKGWNNPRNPCTCKKHCLQE
ncbi:hypothetical protein FRC01_000586 [Tulasnella sp. 417]|nr:hypothetical protein FRC01_000586 [Tulasnella sp. 417]